MFGIAKYGCRTLDRSTLDQRFTPASDRGRGVTRGECSSRVEGGQVVSGRETENLSSGGSGTMISST